VEITAVKIQLVPGADSKLKAFACVVIDNCFVIRDIKVISRLSGLFVAMPSRKLTFACLRCNSRNHLRAKYCNDCGSRLAPPLGTVGLRGRVKLYADIAHPISPECRDVFHRAVITAYQQAVLNPGQADSPPPESCPEAACYFDNWDEVETEPNRKSPLAEAEMEP
jgi:stage V sporulation protein G